MSFATLINSRCGPGRQYENPRQLCIALGLDYVKINRWIRGGMPRGGIGPMIDIGEMLGYTREQARQEITREEGPSASPPSRSAIPPDVLAEIAAITESADHAALAAAWRVIPEILRALTAPAGQSSPLRTMLADADDPIAKASALAAAAATFQAVVSANRPRTGGA